MSRIRGSLHERGTPARVVDFLSAEQRWISAELVAEFMNERHGIATNTTTKALRRLEERGLVSKRLVQNDYGRGYLTAEYRSDHWAAG